MKKLLLLVITILTALTISGCNQPSMEDEIIFDLILGEEVFVEVGDAFIDPGFIVYYDNDSLSDYVTSNGTVNTSVEGTYTINYTLIYEEVSITKTRTVTVGGFGFDCETVEELIVEELDTTSINTECEAIEDTTLMKCQVVWGGTYLNTVVKATIYVEQDTTFNTNEAFYEIETILARYTMISDKYKEYGDVTSVCSVNQAHGVETVIDQDLYDLIDYTIDNQADVLDFYDATMGTVLNVWHDYRDNCLDNSICAVPNESLLNTADKYTGRHNISLNETNTSITLNTNTTLDLGGISKGYVSKLINDYLDTLDIRGYLINNGESNVSAGGIHPTRDNGNYIIAITNPENPYGFFPDNIYATVYLKDGEQLVTSGDYQKYYVVNGTSYHHIISPDTLMPLSNSRSVSIITSDAAMADLYSTAIFNMTIEDGQAFVNGIDGLEAIWYGMDGTIYFSENFEDNHLVDLYE